MLHVIHNIPIFKQICDDNADLSLDIFGYTGDVFEDLWRDLGNIDW